jgi:hypothetical protein
MADRLDLDAIAADDALLDLLAAGGESAWEAGEYDPALKLLADLRIAVEVEDELPVETIDDPESFLARCAALNPVTDPLARKIAARGLALAVAAVAALSVSGVAAAVTGDPLSPYEKVIEKVVDGLRPQTSFPKEQLDGMPLVDKTKLVRVVKDYREKQQRDQQEEIDRRLNHLVDPPQELTTGDPRPPLARPTPPEKPTTVAKPTVEPTTVTTSKPDVGKPTVQPTQTPPPPTDPTPPPTETTPPPTDPTTPPPTGTTTGPTGTTTDPTAGPEDATAATGEEQPASGPTQQSDPAQPGTGSQTDAADGSTAGDQTPPAGSTTQPGEDTTPTGSPTQPGEHTTPTGSPTQPGEHTTPTGSPTQRGEHTTPTEDPPESLPAGPSSTEQERAKSAEKAAHKSFARHSNGKYALGYAKAKYATGKHSSGHYAEGRHAALSRAHGSMAPKALRQILVVINGVMEPVRSD